MLYLLAGPVVCAVGIGAIFFILRRKSVEKRSMYSARRAQIEHKVRAARQRTLTPRGHAPEKPVEAAPAGSPFDQVQVQPTINYDLSAYQRPAAASAPPVAPPTPPPFAAPPEPAWETPAQPQAMPWETGPSEAAPAAAPSFDYPAAPPEQPFTPAAEPTPRAQPSEPAWTPAPQPAEPAVPMQQPVAAATASAGSWEIVSTAKEMPITAETGRKKKDKGQAAESSWQLASGEAPGTAIGDEEAEVKRPNANLVAAAQYAVLVVGLVMVLIGVLVMVANSHVT